MILDLIICALSIFMGILIFPKNGSHSSRTRKFLIAFAIVIAILSFVNTLYSNKSRKEIVENQEIAAQLQDSLLTLQGNLFSFQTSEDCYVFLLPQFTLRRDSTGLSFDIIRVGDWPVRDISIKLLDRSNIQEISNEPNGLRDYLEAEHAENYYIPVISTPWEELDYSLDISGRDWLYFVAEISTLNGNWLEWIALRYIENQWIFAIRLSWRSYTIVSSSETRHMTPQGIVYEYTSPEFPLDSLGNPLWTGE